MGKNLRVRFLKRVSFTFPNQTEFQMRQSSLCLVFFVRRLKCEDFERFVRDSLEQVESEKSANYGVQTFALC